MRCLRILASGQIYDLLANIKDVCQDFLDSSPYISTPPLYSPLRGEIGGREAIRLILVIQKLIIFSPLTYFAIW
jgi:hypothetical protein